MLNQTQIDFFNENGFLRLEQVYTPAELATLQAEMDTVIREFAFEAAWIGPWRERYMTEEENQKASMIAIHELQHYSAAWTRAITKPELAVAIATLMDTQLLELHHTTLHAKPPAKGAPFPMHQDIPFYDHEDHRYIDALVHLDDADETSGCIKFLAGSHRLGKLEHIVGPNTAPHLPPDQYRLDDAVSVEAKAGDVVVFHLWTIHGSAVNHSGRWRRLVRMGFRDPRNRQLSGQRLGTPGLMVKGARPRTEGIEINVEGNAVR